MKRDRESPALEIELQPIAPAIGSVTHRGALPPAPAPDRRRRRFTVAGLIVAAIAVFVTLSALGDDKPDPEAETATPTSAPTAAPTTLRTLGPNVLGTASTRLLLWSFDSQYRLQVVDLDSGEVRPLGVRGGFALWERRQRNSYRFVSLVVAAKQQTGQTQDAPSASGANL